MKKRLQYVPFIAITAFFIVGKIFAFGTTPLKATTLILSLSGMGALVYLRRSNAASPIDNGMIAFLVLSALAFWFWHRFARRNPFPQKIPKPSDHRAIKISFHITPYTL